MSRGDENAGACGLVRSNFIGHFAGRPLLREDPPAALAQVLARARALQQLPGGGDFALQFLQLGDFPARQRLPPLGRRGAFAESIKELPRFSQAKAQALARSSTASLSKMDGSYCLQPPTRMGRGSSPACS
jgi:hypothetical protein